MVRLILTLFLIFSFTAAPVSTANAAGQTGDSQQIELLQDHMIIHPQEAGIVIQEILLLKNTGAEPFKGSSLKDASGQEQTGWLFPLPKGFTEAVIEGLSDNEFSIVKDGVQIYKPIPPGETQIIIFYSYASAYPISFTKNVPLPTQSFFLISPDTYPVQSDTLKTGDTVQFNGISYFELAAENVAPDTRLNFTVKNKAGSFTQNGTRLTNGYKVTGHPNTHVALFNSEPLVYTNPHIWALYLFVMLGLAVAASILFFRQKPKGKTGLNLAPHSGVDQEDLRFLKLKLKQDRLIGRLEALDADYQSGKIPAAEYEEMRNNYQKLLVQVRLELGELAEGVEGNA